MPDPVLWLTRMYGLVVRYGLHASIERLAWALVLMLFAYGWARAIWFSRGSEFSLLVGRLLLAGSLLLALPELRAVTHNGWVAVYAWSSGVWSPGGIEGASSLAERLMAASETFDEELGAFIAADAILREGGTGAGVRGMHALALDASSPLASSIPLMAGAILMILVPILFAIYATLIFVSGLVVLFGELLLPLAAALLLLPGGAGASWLGQWLRMYAGAIFTTAFLPLVFGMIVDLGFAQPAEQMAAGILEALDYLQEAAAEIQARAAEQEDPAWWRLDQQARAWAEETFAMVGAYLSSVAGILLGWLVSLVMIVAGFILGLVLLLRLERYVRGFLGGITAGAAGTVSGTAVFAALRGSRLLRGGASAGYRHGGPGGSSPPGLPPGSGAPGAGVQPQGGLQPPAPTLGGPVSPASRDG